MNYTVADECTILSDEEKITFPEVVYRLMRAGIGLYHADLLQPSKTYYWENTAYSVNCLKKYEKVADHFDAAGVIKAIRQIQLGEIK